MNPSEPSFCPQSHFLQTLNFKLLMNSDILSELLNLTSLLLFIVLMNEFYLIILHTRINISNTNCNFNTMLSSKPTKILEVHVRPTLFQHKRIEMLRYSRKQMLRRRIEA